MKSLHMGLAFGLLFACAAPQPSAGAAVAESVAAVSGATLPPAAFADAETSTNVPFAAGRDGAKPLAFTLSCRATPTNGVEVAFGRDADSDGALGVEEADFVVGWDCGAWFVQEGVDGARLAVEPAGAREARTLAGWIGLRPPGRTTRLVAAEAGRTLFGRALSASDPRGWDTVRLTGRGLDDSGESLSVWTEPDSLVIQIR